MHPPLKSPRRATPLLACALALLAAGCEEERHDGSAPKKARSAASAKTKKEEPVYIVGKRTQDIKDAGSKVNAGQARQAPPRITARDPITLQGNAYVVAIGQIAKGQIDHAVDLFHATNDRYPRDFDEFMNEIIKANNISLPTLPRYQEYNYDADKHKLIILEYDDRK